MENFNELFEKAAKIADHRNKVFNQLIEKTLSEILPEFCKACAGFGIETVYFNTEKRVNNYCDPFYDNYGELSYVIAIDIPSQKYSDAKPNFGGGDYVKNFYVPQSYLWYDFNSIEHVWQRNGIVEFVKAINSRLADYNKKYEARNKVVESLL